MNWLYFILFFLLSGYNYSSANGTFHSGIGPTVSYFLDAENAKPKIGITFGFNRDFHLYKKFSLSAGMSFASRGAILKNRTIAPYATQPTEAFYHDIHGMIGYLEFPVLFQYEIPVSKKVKIKPLLGPVLSFPMIDLSHFEKGQFFSVKIPGEGGTDYDFSFEQESVFGNNFNKNNLSKIIILNFAIQLRYSNYIFEIMYIMDNREKYHFKNLSEVNHKMNSIYFLISFKLKSKDE